MSEPIRYSAGLVTAFGAAVRGGYTGTYEQWCQDMANLGANLSEVREKAAQAAGNAATASGFASSASENATAAANSAGAAASHATAAAGSATAAGNAQSAAETAQEAAEAAQGKAEDAQEAAEQAQSAAETAAQGVSQSATQISQNAADISGLKSALTNVSDDTSNIWNPATKWNEHTQFKASTQTIVSSNYHALTNPVDISQGYYMIDAEGIAPGTTVYVFWFDETTYISSISSNTLPFGVNIPSTANKIRLETYNPNQSVTEHVPSFVFVGKEFRYFGKEEYKGNLDGSKFNQGTITVDKLAPFVPGKNIFNADWMLGGISSTGEETTSARAAKTDRITPINPSTVYAISYENDNLLSVYIRYYDSNGVYLDSVSLGTGSNAVITTPSGAYGLRLQTAHSTYVQLSNLSLDNVQIEIGEFPTEYEPFRYVLSPEHIDSENDSYFDANNTNIFNVALDLGSIDFTTGDNKTGNHNARTINYIPVEHGAYRFTTQNTAGLNVYVYFYTDNTYERYVNLKVVHDALILVKPNETKIRFMLFDGENRYTTLSQYDLGDTILSPGFESTPYTEPKVDMLNSDYLNPVKMPVWDNQNLEVVAHRGAMWFAPENTLPAFAVAAKLGFKVVETDVMKTSDGHYVLWHNPTLEAVGDSTHTIADYTLSELQAMDFGSYKNPYWAGTKICTFEEFVTFCKKTGLYAYIEYKASGLTANDAEYLVSYVHKLGMGRHAAWLGSDAVAQYMRQYDPKCRLVIIGSPPNESRIEWLAGLNVGDKTITYGVESQYVTPELAERLSAVGVGLSTWQTDTLESLEEVIPYVETVTIDKLYNAAQMVRDSAIEAVLDNF